MLIAALFLAVGVPGTSAHDDPAESPHPSPSLRPRQELRNEMKEERSERRKEIQTARQEFRSDVAENHAARLERRFGLYSTRFTGIFTRFQSRIDILKNEGKDTALVQTKLDAAKLKLDEAETKGKEAVAAFRAIDPAKFEEQKEKAFAARDLAVSARKLFVDTHNLLKDALKELKNISKPALPAASAAVRNSTGGTQ